MPFSIPFTRKSCKVQCKLLLKLVSNVSDPDELIHRCCAQDESRDPPYGLHSGEGPWKSGSVGRSRGVWSKSIYNWRHSNQCKTMNESSKLIFEAHLQVDFF